MTTKENQPMTTKKSEPAVAIENEVPVKVVNIYSALVEAQSSAKGVEKGARNAHQGYKYASSESIIEEARECLNAAGLAVVRVASQVAWEDAREVTANGKTKTVRVGVVRCTYSLVHVGGESLVLTSETPAVTEAGRPEDKAVATALTYSLGYFLRDLLLLPRVEEGTDVDQRNDTEHKPAPAPKLSALALELADRAAAAQGAAEWQQVVAAAQSAGLTDAERAHVKRALAASPARPAKQPEVTS